MVNNQVITFALVFVLVWLFSGPRVSWANGGDQRVIESKYLINLSRSPFTPRVGNKVSFLASFVDLPTDKLLRENLLVKVRVAKPAENRGRQFLFEKTLPAKGGILEWEYTFNDPGLHEIFFDFSVSEDPQKIYSAPDFLLDVQKSEVSQKTNPSLAMSFLVGLALGIAGFAAGWFLGQRVKKYGN